MYGSPPPSRPPPLFPPKEKICTYCRNSGDLFYEYRDHTNDQCKRLHNLPPCIHCGATGTSNHTEMYCPQRPRVSLPYNMEVMGPIFEWARNQPYPAPIGPEDFPAQQQQGPVASSTPNRGQSTSSSYGSYNYYENRYRNRAPSNEQCSSSSAGSNTTTDISSEYSGAQFRGHHQPGTSSNNGGYNYYNDQRYHYRTPSNQQYYYSTSTSSSSAGSNTTTDISSEFSGAQFRGRHQPQGGSSSRH